MRRLTKSEIKTLGKARITLAKVELKGLTETGSGVSVVKHQILVQKVDFRPDEEHIGEAAALDGSSFCYQISLISDGILKETKYFTQCFESDIFIHVGNYMGTAYMRNTLDDRYYLETFDSSIDG